MSPKERPSPYTLPHGKEVKVVWDPNNSTTPLEREWARLPQLVKDYFEVGYLVNDPKMTKEERITLLDKRRDMLGTIIRNPQLLEPMTDFIEHRDREEAKRRKVKGNGK